MQAAYSRTLTTIAVLIFLGGVFIVSWTISSLSFLKETQGSSVWKDGVFLGMDGVVLQDKENTCGPASLKMVLDHFGVRVSLRELERKTRLTVRGSSLAALKEAAELFGLHAEGMLLNEENLCHAPTPLLLFVGRRHFVVLDSLDRGGHLFVRDPAIGRMKILSQTLGDIWKGETLVFGDHALPQSFGDLK